MDKEGEPKAIYFNHRTRGWFYDCPVEKMHDMMVALRTFHDCCYEPRNLVSYRLKTGKVDVVSKETRHVFGGHRRIAARMNRTT